MGDYTILSFYKFMRIKALNDLKLRLLKLMKINNILGTIIISEEGINGGISGDLNKICNIINYLQSTIALEKTDYQFSYHSQIPFSRPKVKIKEEIVNLGFQFLNFEKILDSYISPEDWNKLLLDPEVVLVDVRNNYEVDIGTFKGSLNPNINNFRQFPHYVNKSLSIYKKRKVATFCTGGIRCEKSVLYLKSQGFEKVYQLKGGILGYFRDSLNKEKFWKGDCFVFDDRLSVNQDLNKVTY